MIHSEPLRSYLQSPAFLEPLNIPAGTALDFSPLGQGEYNLNYSFRHPVSGQKLVLRINRGSQMHLGDQIGYEFSALHDLIPSGRTPKPLFCDPAQNLLVMEWLPGGPLDYRQDMETAARILADIHSVPVPENCKLLRPDFPARAIYDECLQMVAHYFSWDEADPKICGLLQELIHEIGKLPLSEPSDAPLCIVNTELNSGNFLISRDDHSHLVDWEKPLVSEPAQDLGHFLAPTTTFWKTDVGGRMDCTTLSRRLPLFFTVTCLRGVTWSAMALREYCQPGRELRNEDTFAKLKAYMTEDFLTNILKNYVRKDFLA